MSLPKLIRLFNADGDFSLTIDGEELSYPIAAASITVGPRSIPTIHLQIEAERIEIVHGLLRRLHADGTETS